MEAAIRKTSGAKVLKSSISKNFQFILPRDTAYSLKGLTVIPSGFIRSLSHPNVNRFWLPSIHCSLGMRRVSGETVISKGRT